MTALLLLGLAAPLVQEPAETAVAPAPLERIAILGASASYGFNTSAEVGVTVGLAEAIDAMIQGETRVVADVASQFLFRDPIELGAKQVDKVLEAEPTLVFAVDFLFWFAYDGTLDEASRMPRLETGLAMLERVTCPIVVGDVPDMSPAVGGWIHQWNLPEPETRARMNERVRAWAAERENVSFVSLDDLVLRMRADREVTVLGEVVPAGSTRELLHTDELHPTLLGICLLAAQALDAVLPAENEEARGFVDWSWRDAAKVVYDSKAEERAAAEERRRKREERRKEREKERAGR